MSRPDFSSPQGRLLLVDTNVLWRFRSPERLAVLKTLLPILRSVDAVESELKDLEDSLQILRLFADESLAKIVPNEAELAQAEQIRYALGGSYPRNYAESLLLAVARRTGGVVWTDDDGARKYAQLKADPKIDTVDSEEVLLAFAREQRNAGNGWRLSQPNAGPSLYQFDRIAQEDFVARSQQAGWYLSRNGLTMGPAQRDLGPKSKDAEMRDLRFYPDVELWTALLQNTVKTEPFLRQAGARLVMTDKMWQHLVERFVEDSTLATRVREGIFTSPVEDHVDPDLVGSIADALVVAGFRSGHYTPHLEDDDSIRRWREVDATTIAIARRDPRGRFVSFNSRSDDLLSQLGVKEVSCAALFEAAALLEPTKTRVFREGHEALGIRDGIKFDKSRRNAYAAGIGAASLLPAMRPPLMKRVVGRFTGAYERPFELADQTQKRISWLPDRSGEPVALRDINMLGQRSTAISEFVAQISQPRLLSQRGVELTPVEPNGDRRTLEAVMSALQRDPRLWLNPELFSTIAGQNGDFSVMKLERQRYANLLVFFRQDENTSTTYLVGTRIYLGQRAEHSADDVALMDSRWAEFGGHQQVAAADQAISGRLRL